MSDYFDQIEQDLRAAVRRQAHLPWYVRARRRHPRSLVAVFACLVVAGPALAATGVFRTGTPVAASVMAVPNAFDGVAIPSTARLLPLHVADPAGGPSWTLRTVNTTRGLTCVQLGRYVNGVFGVIGRDGAFANDGRIHPMSLNFSQFPFSCGSIDAGGHAFINDKVFELPASGIIGEGLATNCPPLPTGLGPIRTRHTEPACPVADLRDVYFGLLGPRASSITYVSANGKPTTMSVVGPDGAYLIVLPHAIPAVHSIFENGAIATGGPDVTPGIIETISYRDAPNCQLPTATQIAIARKRAKIKSLTASCPPVGYATPREHHAPPAASLATPVTARIVPAKSYCAHLSDFVPCDGSIPAGYTRLSDAGQWPRLLVVINFKARTSVTTNAEHYEIEIGNPIDPRGSSCPVAGAATSSFGPTEANLRAGQTVRYATFVDPKCPGKATISVFFYAPTAATSDIPAPDSPGEGGGIPVGTTTIDIPNSPSQ